MALSLGGDWWWVVPLKALFWGRCYLTSVIKCTLSKFADDMKLSSAVNTEGRDVIQGTRTNLRSEPMRTSWSSTSQIASCHVWVRAITDVECRLGEATESSPAKKHLAVLVDEKLDMSQECVLTAQKVTGILCCIKSSMARRSREVTLLHYSTLLRQWLQCCIQLWGPWHQKVTDLLEQVQRRDMETIHSGQKDNSRTRNWNIAILNSYP